MREAGENNFNEDEDDCPGVPGTATPHVPMNAAVLINGLFMEAVKKSYETQKQTKISDYMHCKHN